MNGADGGGGIRAEAEVELCRRSAGAARVWPSMSISLVGLFGLAHRPAPATGFMVHVGHAPRARRCRFVVFAITAIIADVEQR